uniref:Uncharacterized protein n=1 Tax=Chromera velia CCMP2878 TaxID=1169474 RepID=A0A0G4FJC4_9ALVE|eukprot:Cvel_17129.t1-p1 / transcript=Cvel_17129.t1 / gene=Cvel_17129 / organism=Chromera_velia_CCMP2878 / gene_product=WD repeat domain-containing protein 83, putative / transcript_product=WD repeat domain-containing protein 83, putative / location=Cvel_scaffold1351:42520-44860(+) / protein_length=322 / sequence_SO=supercontig / SO=protein_coding / is_pseudo=false
MSFSLSPENLLFTLEGHRAAVQNVKFNLNSKYCMSCSADKAVRLWNPHRGVCIREYAGPHNHEVNDVSITGDNSRFVSVGGDRLAFLWDVSTGQVIRKFMGHNGRINFCEFAHTGDVFVTGSYDKTVRFWDMRARNRNAIQTIDDEFRDSVTCCVLTKEDVICGSLDGSVRSFDLRMGRVSVDQIDRGHVTGLSISRDERCLLAFLTGRGGAVCLIERGAGDVLQTYTGHQNESYRLQGSFDSSDSFVVSGSEDGRICVWKVEDSSPQTSFRAHQGTVFCVRFPPDIDEHIMVSAGSDKLLRVWATRREDIATVQLPPGHGN